MSVELNHTIVWCTDRHRSAEFLAEMFGLPEPKDLYHFRVVEVANGVSLDFSDRNGPSAPQHYAFLISEAEFDAVMEKIAEKKMEFWADPLGQQPGEINRNDGGRGVYFRDPDGHYLEALTVPYGGWKS